jgi:hypothetical protein
VEDCLNSPLCEDILAGTRAMLDHFFHEVLVAAGLSGTAFP